MLQLRKIILYLLFFFHQAFPFLFSCFFHIFMHSFSSFFSYVHLFFIHSSFIHSLVVYPLTFFLSLPIFLFRSKCAPIAKVPMKGEIRARGHVSLDFGVDSLGAGRDDEDRKWRRRDDGGRQQLHRNPIDGLVHVKWGRHVMGRNWVSHADRRRKVADWLYGTWQKMLWTVNG